MAGGLSTLLELEAAGTYDKLEAISASVEKILVDGQAVGELSSVGWSPKAGACVGLGYVRGDAAQAVHEGTPALIDLWGEPVAATAWDRWTPSSGA